MDSLLLDLILDQQELLRDLSDSVRVKVREALLKKHHHQNERRRNNLIPIVRSFAEVGKKQSDPHSMDRDGEGAFGGACGLFCWCCCSALHLFGGW